MEQDKIWNFYQNDNRQIFEGAIARLSYLTSLVARNEKILNIGVGDGYLEKILTKKGCLVSALDPSKKSIEKLREALHLGERARVGYSQEIPFGDKTFDVVIMSEVLEHLSDKALKKTLLEVRRVLLPGGRFMGTVPAQENLLEQMVICPDCGKQFHRWGHTQSFNIDRLTNLLATQFELRKVTEKVFVTWSNLNWKGKLVAMAKLTLRMLGIHGSGENIFFLVGRAGNDR